MKRRKGKANTSANPGEIDYREQGLRIFARIIVRKRLAEMKLFEAEHMCNGDENQFIDKEDGH